MLWDCFGTPELRSNSVGVSRWPEKQLCLGSGTGRLSLGTEHLPGLGEEHLPPSHLWCLNCYQEYKPLVLCSVYNQIFKKSKSIRCNKGQLFIRHHLGLSCSSNDNFCGGHQTVQFIYNRREVFLLCMFFKAFWTTSFTKLFFGCFVFLFFGFFNHRQTASKIRLTIRIYKKHSSYFLILESSFFFNLNTLALYLSFVFACRI